VLCVIDFSFSVICVLLILLNSIKLPKSVVEVDLVLCFSILHNLLIYSGNFYRLITKIEHKIHTWCNSWLSRVGRLVL